MGRAFFVRKRNFLFASNVLYCAQNNKLTITEAETMNENAYREYQNWLSHAQGEVLDELKAMEGNEALIE